MMLDMEHRGQAEWEQEVGGEAFEGLSLCGQTGRLIGDVQCLRVLTLLEEVQGSLPSTHPVAHSCRGSSVLLQLPQHYMHMVHIRISMCILEINQKGESHKLLGWLSIIYCGRFVNRCLCSCDVDVYCVCLLAIQIKFSKLPSWIFEIATQTS